MSPGTDAEEQETRRQETEACLVGERLGSLDNKNHVFSRERHLES